MDKIKRWLLDWLLVSLSKDSNLVSYAQMELDDDGSEWRESVLSVIRAFSLCGHSGGSAPPTIATIHSLLQYKPLGPLTGEDEEWNEVVDNTFQNRRCSHVFKDADGEAYDIQGKIFREPNGATYTSIDSRVPVVFPYTPASEYVNVEGDHGQ